MGSLFPFHWLETSGENPSKSSGSFVRLLCEFGLFIAVELYSACCCSNQWDWRCAALQVNRFNKVEDRAIFITDRHLYKMDPMKQYKVMKTIPLYNVSTKSGEPHPWALLVMGVHVVLSSIFIPIKQKKTLGFFNVFNVFRMVTVQLIATPVHHISFSFQCIQ